MGEAWEGLSLPHICGGVSGMILGDENGGEKRKEDCTYW
jgi:hypothetical protein